MKNAKTEVPSRFQLKFDKVKILKAMLPVIGILVGALVGSLVILAKGVNPIYAYAALLQGAVGSVDNLTSSLAKSIPLGLTGLAVIFSYKAGIFNIGCEGPRFN